MLRTIELGCRRDRWGRNNGRGRQDGCRVRGGKRLGSRSRLGDGRRFLGVLLACRSFRLLAHSGGSSPKTRFHIKVAARVVATLESAPNPASRLDHMSRLTKGLSVIGGDSIRLGGRSPARVANDRGYFSTPRQIVSTIRVFARSSSSSLTGVLSKIHPVSTCSIEP